MRIYLDSKDIIELLEKSNPCTAAEFDSFLRDGNHEIVLSYITIAELSEPLFHNSAETNVMRLLNQIEGLPHIFIHSSKIPRLELEKAYCAFASGNEYEGILPPFVNRFDITCDLQGRPPTGNYINYPLAEIVWERYICGDRLGLNEYGENLRDLFKADRALNPKPTLKENFAKTIERDMRLYQLEISPEDVMSFANWIYKNPKRCPSERIGYELSHKMLKNITDIPNDSDMGDHAHITALPYVDVMTLDRRMHGYVCQVSKELSTEYNEKIFRSFEEILSIPGI